MIFKIPLESNQLNRFYEDQIPKRESLNRASDNENNIKEISKQKTKIDIDLYKTKNLIFYIGNVSPFFVSLLFLDNFKNGTTKETQPLQ